MERDEFLDYLKALCESLGVDNDVEGAENPKLALAARIQLRIMAYERSNRIMHQALSHYADKANWLPPQPVSNSTDDIDEEKARQLLFNILNSEKQTAELITVKRRIRNPWLWAAAAAVIAAIFTIFQLFTVKNKNAGKDTIAKKENKLKYREDHSNESDDYLRNKIRHHLIPLLEQLNPSFEKTMTGNLQNLSFADHVFKELFLCDLNYLPVVVVEIL